MLFLGCLSACLTRKKSSSRVPSGPQGASAPPSPSGPPAGHTGSGEAGPQCPRPGEEVGDAFLPSEQRTQTLPTRWLAEQGHHALDSRSLGLLRPGSSAPKKLRPPRVPGFLPCHHIATSGSPFILTRRWICASQQGCSDSGASPPPDSPSAPVNVTVKIGRAHV